VRALRKTLPRVVAHCHRTQVDASSEPAPRVGRRRVTINSRDVADMKNCKPGDCVVKLPATDMRAFIEQMNWSAPPSDLQAQLSAYAHRRLVEYVTDYRRRGDSAMAIYERSRQPQTCTRVEAFAAQLAESPYVLRVLCFPDYLATLPARFAPAGARRDPVLVGGRAARLRRRF